MYFQFNPLPLVEEPNVQLPKQIWLDSSLNSSYGDKTLGRLSVENVQRALFNMPLPDIKEKPFFTEQSSSNTTGSTDARVMKNVYTIKGKEYTVPGQYYKSAHHFSTVIGKGNEGQENEFNKQFVENFLKEYEENYLQLKQETVGWSNQISNIVSALKVSVEGLLDMHLYNVILSPIRYSLKAHMDQIGGLVNESVKKKGATISEPKTNKTDPEISSKNGGVYIFHGRGQCPTAFMGIHCYPDLFIGVAEEPNSRRMVVEPVSATILGETKTPALCLRGVYDVLTEKGQTLDNQEQMKKVTREVTNKDTPNKKSKKFRIKFDKTTGAAVTNSREINEVQEPIKKLVTVAVYAGVNRIMLTTYKEFVLIHIDPNFIIVGQEH